MIAGIITEAMNFYSILVVSANRTIHRSFHVLSTVWLYSE